MTSVIFENPCLVCGVLTVQPSRLCTEQCLSEYAAIMSKLDEPDDQLDYDPWMDEPADEELLEAFEEAAKEVDEDDQCHCHDAAEARNKFIDGIRSSIAYWADSGTNEDFHKNKELLESFTHSLLAMIDGVSGQWPMEVNIEVDGHNITDGVMLHDEFL